MDPKLINWAAVVVAALSAFMLGGVWYAKGVFGNAWMAANNLYRRRDS